AGLCHDSKNRAMLRSFRLVPGLYPDDIFCSSLHSLSNTNALYCRAVMWHSKPIKQTFNNLR
ncbi:MAG: hypothetical protein MUO72_05635, partial [Bacteroidales bacterium]|nr:hypothetical protein [Bacteroidales bacterium]